MTQKSEQTQKYLPPCFIVGSQVNNSLHEAANYFSTAPIYDGTHMPLSEYSSSLSEKLVQNLLDVFIHLNTTEW